MSKSPARIALLVCLASLHCGSGDNPPPLPEEKPSSYTMPPTPSFTDDPSNTRDGLHIPSLVVQLPETVPESRDAQDAGAHEAQEPGDAAPAHDILPLVQDASTSQGDAASSDAACN